MAYEFTDGNAEQSERDNKPFPDFNTWKAERENGCKMIDHNRTWSITEETLLQIESSLPHLSEAIRYENENEGHRLKGITTTRTISPNVRYKILKEQKWYCNMCHCKLLMYKNSKWDGKIAHIDHIHPFSKRESYPKGAEFISERENLQGLCEECNLKKGKRDVN
tara:strand:- start:2 stop:496 length:495 start_codon:yes stop_codon:yes gene_type:complete